MVTRRGRSSETGKWIENEGDMERARKRLGGGRHGERQGANEGDMDRGRERMREI